MKILGLVVALMFITCCAAQTNRSSVWLLANTQIFSTATQTSRNCFVSATGKTASAATGLISTNNLAITGQFYQVGSGFTADTNFVPSNSILATLSLKFIYNSTYSITLDLANSGAATAPTLTVLNLFTPGATGPTWTSTVGGSTSTIYPVVTGGNTILTPTGSTWLFFQNVPYNFKTGTAVQTAAIPAAAAYSSIIITDYISSSTIAITQWTDYVDNGVAANNPLYQLGVRTKTSTITSSTSNLLTSTTCTASAAGRKRSVDHLRSKRAVTLSSCSSASSIDPTMTSSILGTACTSVGTVATGANTATGTTTVTNSNLQQAFNLGVTAMNALYQADAAIFGAGSSKYAIAGNFGMLIALSSILFSLLN